MELYLVIITASAGLLLVSLPWLGDDDNSDAQFLFIMGVGLALIGLAVRYAQPIMDYIAEFLL